MKNDFTITTASRLGEVKEYYFSVKLKEIAALNQEGKNILNLGIGSPDLPPHSAVMEALCQHVGRANSHGYQSYAGIPELRKAIAEWYQRYFNVEIDPDQEVLPLIGSKEGLMHIAMTYLEPGDEVLVPNPGYPAYQAVSKLTGADIRFYDLKEENNWLPDLELLSGQDLSKVKLMWVNYPNMPTGAVATRKIFEALVSFGKAHQILIVNDNPYTFILSDQYKSIMAVDGAKEVALELNSLSKSHNMAGWRVGLLVGAGARVKEILRFKSNMDSGMFKPIQMAAAVALGLDESWYKEINKIYRERRKVVFDILKVLDCSFNDNQIGMFVWAKIPKKMANGFDFTDAILNYARVFITPGGIFGTNGDRYIRISLCSEKEVFEEALRRIEESKDKLLKEA
jgi:aspartate/methionine/tyrosine aminotransferase